MKRVGRRRIYVGITLVVVLVIAGSTSGILPFNKAASAVIRPIGQGLQSLGDGIGNKVSELGKLGSFGTQNQALREENNQLHRDIARLHELEDENALLREQLGYARRSDLSTVGAEVISYQPDSIRQFVRINRGSNSGVSVGAAVLSGSALVGKVSQANADSAEVMLINDPDFRVLVSTENGKTTGIVKGQPGGAINMERIPRNQDIKLGDSIVSSGLDGDFPKGLFIGKVESVGDSNESIFLVAALRPGGRLNQLNLLQVVKQ